jgi:hypothetical protein
MTSCNPKLETVTVGAMSKKIRPLRDETGTL